MIDIRLQVDQLLAIDDCSGWPVAQQTFEMLIEAAREKSTRDLALELAPVVAAKDMQLVTMMAEGIRDDMLFDGMDIRGADLYRNGLISEGISVRKAFMDQIDAASKGEETDFAACRSRIMGWYEPALEKLEKHLYANRGKDPKIMA